MPRCYNDKTAGRMNEVLMRLFSLLLFINDRCYGVFLYISRLLFGSVPLHVVTSRTYH